MEDLSKLNPKQWYMRLDSATEPPVKCKNNATI